MKPPSWALWIVVAGVTALVFTTTVAASSQVRLVLPRDFSNPAAGVQPGKRHPHSFRIASADATLYFQDLHWRHWNHRRAFARGQYRWCDSSPCTEVWTSTRVAVSEIRRGDCGQLFYTKANYTTDTGSHVEIGATTCR